MLYFNCSVLKMPPSTRRISRRITLSRVVLLPVKVIRLTKYCSPSVIRIVMFTVGSAGPATGPSAGSWKSMSGKPVNSKYPPPPYNSLAFSKPLRTSFSEYHSPGFSLKSGCRNLVSMTLLPSNLTSPIR